MDAEKAEGVLDVLAVDRVQDPRRHPVRRRLWGRPSGDGRADDPSPALPTPGRGRRGPCRSSPTDRGVVATPSRFLRASGLFCSGPTPEPTSSVRRQRHRRRGGSRETRRGALRPSGKDRILANPLDAHRELAESAVAHRHRAVGKGGRVQDQLDGAELRPTDDEVLDPALEAPLLLARKASKVCSF